MPERKRMPRAGSTADEHDAKLKLATDCSNDRDHGRWHT